MNLIVSDNSPLNLLIRLNQAEVLPRLYTRLFIPPIVRDEMSHPKTPSIVRTFIDNPPQWLQVCTPKTSIAIPGLDPGEVAAIHLAIELQATLLIDELAGRAIARDRGLKIIGAIGILELAANQGFITDLQNVHSQIRSKRFFISERFLADSLARHLAFKKANLKS